MLYALGYGTGNNHASLPEVGSQIDGRSEGLICDNGCTNASGLNWDGIGIAVLYGQVNFVLEFDSVIQVCYQSNRYLSLWRNYSFVGLNPPQRITAGLKHNTQAYIGLSVPFGQAQSYQKEKRWMVGIKKLRETAEFKETNISLL